MRIARFLLPLTVALAAAACARQQAAYYVTDPQTGQPVPVVQQYSGPEQYVQAQQYGQPQYAQPAPAQPPPSPGGGSPVNPGPLPPQPPSGGPSAMTRQQADRLLCESWNERMWSDGEPIDPSPTVDQAINGGFPWLEIRCSRCKTPSDVDLSAMKHPPTTFVHDLASRLRCRKCAKAGRRPAATLLQLGWQPRHLKPEA